MASTSAALPANGGITEGRLIGWEPCSFEQDLFLSSPIFETLFEGTRGPGKTDSLLMDFAQDVGKGYGAAWRGILFRRESKDLDDIIAKSTKWFSKLFPKARLMGGVGRQRWVWPDGEQLLLRIGHKEQHYWAYHGHEYPWIGFDELTAWKDPNFYHMMKSCCRSSHPKVPRKFRATTNPYGPGHSWVKAYLIDPCPHGVPFANAQGIKRLRIHGDLRNNPHLLQSDPDYLARILSDPNPQRRKAWSTGDWDVVAGGYFSDVWSREKHVLPDFTPPADWRRFLSFDWGFSKPASMGKWAVPQNNTVLRFPNRQVFFPKGSLVRFGELYTCEKDAETGVWKPNTGLQLSNADLGALMYRATRDGTYQNNVADPSIFTEDGADSVYTQLVKGAKKEAERQGKADGLPIFGPVDNSRIAGWQKMFGLFQEAAKDQAEGPGMWVTESCVHFIRTVPVIQRDLADPDDVDTDAEDHAADDGRYASMRTVKTAHIGKTRGG